MAIPRDLKAKVDELLPTEKGDGQGPVILDYLKFEELLTCLRRETCRGGMAEPEKYGYEVWNIVLQRMGLLGKSEYRALLEEFQASWWDSMTQYQIDTGLPPKVCYRAIAGYGLAWNRYASGDLESAVRWCGLTRIADVLGELNSGGGAQYMLRGTLGVPKYVDEELTQSAQKARDAGASKGWNVSGVFPEAVLLDTLRGPHFQQFCRRSVILDHSTCRPYYLLALEEARNDSTGKKLERLAAYLVSSLAGFRPRMNVQSQDLAWEHDVVGTPVVPTASILPGFGESLLIECKNWREKKIDAQVVGHLFARMQLIGCRLGLLITRQGTTGAKSREGAQNEKAAKAIIKRLYHQTGHLCLVLEDSDLDRLADMPFRSILHEKYEEFVFGVQRVD